MPKVNVIGFSIPDRIQVDEDKLLELEINQRRPVIESRRITMQNLANGATASIDAPHFEEYDQAVLDAYVDAKKHYDEASSAAMKMLQLVQPIPYKECVPYYKDALAAVYKAIDAHKEDYHTSPLVLRLESYRKELEDAIAEYESTLALEQGEGYITVDEYEANVAAEEERKARAAKEAAEARAKEALERQQAEIERKRKERERLEAEKAERVEKLREELGF